MSWYSGFCIGSVVVTGRRGARRSVRRDRGVGLIACQSIHGKGNCARPAQPVPEEKDAASLACLKARRRQTIGRFCAKKGGSLKGAHASPCHRSVLLGAACPTADKLKENMSSPTYRFNKANFWLVWWLDKGVSSGNGTLFGSGGSGTQGGAPYVASSSRFAQARLNVGADAIGRRCSKTRRKTGWVANTVLRVLAGLEAVNRGWWRVRRGRWALRAG